MKKLDSHIFSGMQRDLSVSKQKAEFLWEANNIRLTAREGDTMLSVTNEKGTAPTYYDSKEGAVTLKGCYIGHCVIGEYLVVFTHLEPDDSIHEKGGDYIFRLHKESTGLFKCLCLTGENGQGEPLHLNLKFSPDYPLQTLGVYESDYIQKVYWTDGINQPRVINIMQKELLESRGVESQPVYIDSSFDFVPKMQLKDSVTVNKIMDSSGMYHAGVIQYIVTYYNLYGQQSNISCTSVLIPVSFSDRAGSADERVGNSFIVTIYNPDTNFEYVRVYSLLRTSLDATPACKRVIDLPVSSAVTENGLTYLSFTDNGTIGDDVDPQELLYVGGEAITANTIEAQEGTLFLGDITIKRPYIKDVQKSINELVNNNKFEVYSDYRYAFMQNTIDSSYYSWQNSLMAKQGASLTNVDTFTSINHKIGNTIPTPVWHYDAAFANIPTNGFKYHEHYRLGVQFQHETGKWSDPIWIGDYMEENQPKYEEFTYATSDPFETETIVDSEKQAMYSIPVFMTTLSQNICTALSENGYLRARGVMAVPSQSDRLIYAQGILNPTVGNVVYSELDSPSFQSSWFFRPCVSKYKSISGKENDPYNTSEAANYGSSIEYRHMHTLFGFNNKGAEIQGVPIGWGGQNLYTNTMFQGTEVNFPNDADFQWGRVFEDTDGKIKADPLYRDTCYNIFYVDQQNVTMHSPEFEFDDSLQCMDNSTVKMRISGRVNFEANIGDIDIQTSSPAISSKGRGFVHKILKNSNYTYADKRLCAGLFYYDALVTEGTDETGENKYAYVPYSSSTKNGKTEKAVGYMVYPWQASGSLNNDCAREEGYGTRSAVLQRKIISNLKFSKETVYCSNGYDITNTFDNFSTDKKEGRCWFDLFTSDQVQLVKLGDYNYYGNVDQVLIPPVPYSSLFLGPDYYDTNSTEYNRWFTPQFTTVLQNVWFGVTPYSETPSPTFVYVNLKSNEDNKDHTDYMNNPYQVSNFKGCKGHFEEERIGSKNTNLVTHSSSVVMKYKSTPHLVAHLKGPLGGIDDTTNVKKPFNIGNYSITEIEKLNTYADLPITATSTTNSENSEESKSFLYLAELYREANADSDFGGTNTGQNLWIPVGDAVEINNSGTTIWFDYGDTWYQRYDCLKTYAFTQDDPNSIVEIGSFMVESHINLDGRYDKNRGQDSNLYMSPQNFNLVNKVYSQSDNFFKYNIQRDDYYSMTSYPATITWTTSKNNASEIDNWTTATLASTLETDGTKGRVTDIVSHANNLYAFQERGISLIMFNSRVAINTSDDIPIEIKNSNKVDGNKYFATSIGCSNKFAVTKSSSGVYFVDDVGESLYLLKGTELANVSEAQGFNYWFDQQDCYSSWRPSYWISDINDWNKGSGLSLYYDNNKKDLYINTTNKSLCYSEILGKFTSFMDYQGGILFNVGSSFHALTNNNGETVSMWNMFEGEHNSFFYKRYQSDLTFISNAESTLDKIFTNLEIRADFYNEYNELQHEKFFDTIRAWNEYQDTETVALKYKSYPYEEGSIHSNTKKKFRIWRCDIPRAIKNGKRSFDRIRNTWCKIKLSMNTDDAQEPLHMEMHDVGVVYYN